MKKKPYIVGICGGTASGKTFLLKQLMSQFPKEQICLLSLDNYYKLPEEQKKDEEGMVNFDHPDSLHLDNFYKDVKKLMAGETVVLQEHTFNNPVSTAKTLTFEPAPILILEGLFVFYVEEVRKLIDLKLFVDADEHIRISRRLLRDLAERNYSIEYTLHNYQKYVAPMYEKYVKPAKKQADLIVRNNKQMYKVVKVLVNHLRTVSS